MSAVKFCLIFKNNNICKLFSAVISNKSKDLGKQSSLKYLTYITAFNYFYSLNVFFEKKNLIKN